MDSFGWENPGAIRAGISLPPTSIWSNHCNNNLNDKSALLNSTDAFLSSSSELQRILAACHTSSNFDTVSESISANKTLDQDLLQFDQEAILASDSLLGAAFVGNTFSPHQLHACATPTETLRTCQDSQLQAIGNMINSQGDISALFSSCCRGNISSSEYSGSQNLEDVASQGSSKLEATRHVEPPRGRRQNSTSSCSRKRRIDDDDPATAIVDGSKQHICSLLELNSPLKESGFQISFTRSKKAKSEGDSTTIDFVEEGKYEPDNEAIAQVKEMIYRAAALRPVSLAAEAAAKEKPKRKNVKISSDPQTMAARQRRERISERLRVLQRLVPGGTKLDTASMLDEAANYLKFLKAQVKALQTLGNKFDHAVNSSTTQSSTFPLPLNHAFDPMQSLFLNPKH